MPNPPNGRPAALINAEIQARADLEPAVARCLHCPKWMHAGTAIQCRIASASHRAQYHSDIRPTKRRRSHVSRFNPGLESDRVAGEARAAETARMLARRGANEAAA